MNKYRKLVNNSLIFAVGNLGSKLVQFILIPLYSYTLTTSDFGKADLLTQMVYLLTPIISLELFDAAFRFALDKTENKIEIFNSVFVILIIGSIITLLIGYILGEFIHNYPILITAVFLIFNIFYSFFSNFIRAINYTKQFAAAGIVNTFGMGTASIIFLVVLKMGITGYMLSFIVGLLFGCIYIFLTTDLIHYIKLSEFDFSTLTKMLKYSIPLIPNYFAWWLNASSDRLFIIAMIGDSANGLYAMANKIPNFINVLVMIFSQSWQISVVEEYRNKENKKFISDIFISFISIVFIAGVLILAFIKPFFYYGLDRTYFNAWKLTPLLVLAVIYSGIAIFLEAIYTAYKETVSVLTTTIYGALINIALTMGLIPTIGYYGAALANAMSFLVVAIFRIKGIEKKGILFVDVKRIVFYHLFFGIMCLVLFSLNNMFLIVGTGIFISVFMIFSDKNIRKQVRVIMKKN